MFAFFRKTGIVLFFILILAGLLRTVKLSELPAGFHGDEAAYGYNAYSLLKTGADEYGKRFPIILKSFEDYKPALYAYIDIPFVAALGLTETAVRLPSAIFGTFTILVLYVLVKQLLHGDETLALLSSLLLAISPWHIMLSRTTSEVIVSMFFILVQLYALMKLQNKFHIVWVMVACISGILALSAYTASRIFVFIVTMIVFLFSIHKANNKVTVSMPILFVLIFIILTQLIYNTVAVNKRFDQVSIFNNPRTQLLLDEQIREDRSTPLMTTRIFHNKLVNYTRTVLQNYSQYLSLDFLALKGGYPQRIRIPDTGLFYIWEIIFLLVGIYIALKRHTREGIFLLCLWFFLLLPATITFDDIPNVYRTVIIVPILIIFIALGIKEGHHLLLSIGNKQITAIFITGLLLIILYEGVYFAHQYIVHENRHQSWYRNYAMKDLISALNQYAPNYQKVIITKTNTSYIHILFYNKIDPRIYQASGSHMDIDNTGFGIYNFTSQECPLYVTKDKQAIQGLPNTLYVNAGVCEVPSSNARVLKTINWGDDTPALRLLEYIPDK